MYCKEFSVLGVFPINMLFNVDWMSIYILYVVEILYERFNLPLNIELNLHVIYVHLNFNWIAHVHTSKI